MGRIRLLWQNHHIDAALDVASEATEWPASHLMLPWPTLVHRTTGVTNEWWRWDLGAARHVDYFIFWGHNFTAGATLTLQANAVDSWTSPPLAMSVARRAGYAVAEPDATYRYWRLVASDGANPDGFLCGGWAYLGPHFEPRYSFARRTRRLEDPSAVMLSVGGQMSSVERTPYTVIAYEFDAVTDADRATLEAMWQAVGRHREFALVEDADDLNTVLLVRATAPWEFAPFVVGFSRWHLEVETIR